MNFDSSYLSALSGAGGGYGTNMTFQGKPLAQGVSTSGQLADSGAGVTAAPSGAVPASAATAANPTAQATSSSAGGQIADSIKAIGTMIANYNMAGALQAQQPAANVPNMTLTPIMAQAPMPTMSMQPRQVYA